MLLDNCLLINVPFLPIVINSLNRNDAKTFLNLVYQSDLEMVAPKSAWSTPELFRGRGEDAGGLSYSVRKPKKYPESSFSFENPGGQTSTV